MCVVSWIQKVTCGSRQHQHIVCVGLTYAYILCLFPHNVALEGMVNKLKGKQVSPQLANEFRVCLKLDENDVPADQTDLGIISNKWILKNTASCSPEALVEALVGEVCFWNRM